MNQFEGLSSFSAGLGRLATFVERMESYCDASECAADANATFVLRFNLSAHAKGDTWRQCAACDGDGNLTMSFPPALNFSAPLGAEITAEWRERDLLLVYVVTPADVPPVVGETTVHTQSADCSDDWTAHGCTTTASATPGSPSRKDSISAG